MIVLDVLINRKYGTISEKLMLISQNLGFFLQFAYKHSKLLSPKKLVKF